ncbi:MAG: isoprenylcysteine carboxylmethyltransferase family protein [Candidatus Eremiobacteraeota bacterium]|nr:isoprenylcysteine carboxylmethyltransferase family protein [Candidatus Eremiobacteraeota bacterium]
MSERRAAALQALVFKNRGLLLAMPAAALAILGRPTMSSVALGLPLAALGELVRCWAVGYSGVTTRDDVVTAPQLVTAGPYGYVRNPLYFGNFVTATGFAIAFTGRNPAGARLGLVASSLAFMLAVYWIVVAHEESFLRREFGASFAAYCARVPRIIPRLRPPARGAGSWRPRVLLEAESKTLALFAAMTAVLLLKAFA